MGFGRVPVHLA